MLSKRQMNKNGTEPIVSIEKVEQYAIVVRLWSNHGQKVPHHPRKVPHKQKKALKTNGFQGFDGGDKRDRTADLLNAIQALSQLSYTPIFGLLSDSFRIIAIYWGFVKGFGRKNKYLPQRQKLRFAGTEYAGRTQKTGVQPCDLASRRTV